MTSTNNNGDDVFPRKCLHCGDTFRGRTDKKYCSDTCRNNHHFHNGNSITRRINIILKRNRDILMKILGNETTFELDKQILSEMDFNFNYHTHSRKDESGTVYFCYDYSIKFSKNVCTICKIKSLPTEGEAHLSHR